MQTSAQVQAVVDGSLLILCEKLASQPQIATAYTKQAPMRTKIGSSLRAALQPLQVCNAL